MASGKVNESGSDFCLEILKFAGFLLKGKMFINSLNNLLP
jgi:hypothetical protein